MPLSARLFRLCTHHLSRRRQTRRRITWRPCLQRRPIFPSDGPAQHSATAICLATLNSNKWSDSMCAGERTCLREPNDGNPRWQPSSVLKRHARVTKFLLGFSPRVLLIHLYCASQTDNAMWEGAKQKHSRRDPYVITHPIVLSASVLGLISSRDSRPTSLRRRACWQDRPGYPTILSLNSGGASISSETNLRETCLG